MSASSVSVIIPNYNRESLIGETILNLLGQTVPPLEIIVVDDGSTDRSVEVIQSFGDKVTLLRQSNQGPGAARNAGLRVARGACIQFQDSDDLFSLNKLEAQARLLESTGADIAFSPWAKVRIHERDIVFENHVLQQGMPPEGLSLPEWWLRGWSTVFQGLLFRRSFLDRVGFYRTDLFLGEDGELFFRALTLSPKVAFSAEPLTLYRLHEINKLTRNEGSPQHRRIIDWCWCLRHMMARQEETGLKVDALTRLMFLAEVRRQLGYLRTVPEPPLELKTFLEQRVARASGLLLTAIGIWTRLAERVRLQRQGSRWLPAYRASVATREQKQLIRDLGFNLE